jgi:hypothetical protein
MSYLDLDDDKAYKNWKNYKKDSYERRATDNFSFIVGIDADGTIPQTSVSIIHHHLKRYNFAFYKMNDAGSEATADTTAAIKRIGEQLGLLALDKNLCAQEDRLTQLTVAEQGRATKYIPYTNKAIGWHTDGYYNPMHQRVLAMVMHCQHAAACGGENDVLDPDMVYIHVRDQNPDFIRALSQPKVMCIPANIEDGVQIRAQTCSAVFMPEVGEHAGSTEVPVLAMRYSKRKRNIIWANDELTREALNCLEEFIESDSPWHLRYRLKAGEGVINNNVLHTRTAFTDDAEHKRVYYRARYYNRIKL